MYFGLVYAIQVDLNFINRSVYGGQAKEAKFEGDSMLLFELKWEYPNVFSEPSYPIKINRMPFMIPLIDPSLPPKSRKLYPIS